MSDNPTSAGNQQERLSSLEQRRWFLAGVIEGEGSVCISIKEHRTVPLGYYVQPSFFLYQRKERRALLELAQEEFQGGRIYPKPGNEDVLVYGINSRPLIAAKVLPFLEQYMCFSARRADYRLFAEAIRLYELGQHRTPSGLARIVEIAYAMNLNGKQRKRSKEHVLDRILRGHTLDAPGLGR